MEKKTGKDFFMEQALRWLCEKDRSKEEIAHKMWLAASITYDLVVERQKKDFLAVGVADLFAWVNGENHEGYCK